MKKSKNYIWDYNIKSLDLSREEAILWYLKRKIEYGDWKALDRKILKRYLPKLKIDRYLKEILISFLYEKK